MVRLSSLLYASMLLAVSSAAPLSKRISQIISDSTTKWVAACQASGGGSQCQTLSQNAFMTLLAAAGNCDQQNAADAMITFAKTLQNNTDMITLAQIFVQQPRNAPDGLQVPYCQTAPNNTELTGFFHCQFSSSDFTQFSGDQTGNIPLGLTAVNPPGSCPASLDGPVPDGVQLNTLVSSPGTPITSDSNSTLSGSSASAASSATGAASTSAVAIARRADPTVSPDITLTVNATATATVVASATAAATDSSNSVLTVNGTATTTIAASASGSTNATASATATATATGTNSNSTASSTSSAAAASSTDTSTSNSTATSTSSAAASSSTSASSGNSTTGAGSLANGQAAQALNKQFEASGNATSNSTCTTEGAVSCAGTMFAECANGVLATTACASGTSCFALPLTSGDGTTIACTTQSDAQDRIAATGATGGIDGSS